MPKYLEQSEVRGIYKAVLDHDLRHEGLLAGLPAGYRARFKHDLLPDLHVLNTTAPLADGTLPLKEYLAEAVFLLESRGETCTEGYAALQSALRKISVEAGQAAPVVTNPPFSWIPTGHETKEQLTAGDSTLLGIAYLEVGVQRARSVVCVRVPTPWSTELGTGFLVGPDLVLTNHHVAFPAGGRNKAVVQIGLEDDMNGEPRPVQRFEATADPALSDAGMDWALLRLERAVDHPPLTLAAPRRPLEVDDRVCIIQHPNGGPKKISLHKNVVRAVDREKKRAQYLTDTASGSSGSPVFNTNWDLVALHHAATTAALPDGRPEYRNQGVLIEAVIDGVRAKAPAAVLQALKIG